MISVAWSASSCSLTSRKFSEGRESPAILFIVSDSRTIPLCPVYVQEAANLFWELQTRNTTASFLEGGLPGLRALLRAADGREGNAGVVDLMLRCISNDDDPTVLRSFFKPVYLVCRLDFSDKCILLVHAPCCAD